MREGTGTRVPDFQPQHTLTRLLYLCVYFLSVVSPAHGPWGQGPCPLCTQNCARAS